MRLGGQTITILNATQTGVGRLGVPANSYTVVTQSGCSVQEHRTSREISLTDVSTARFRLFAPATTPLNTTSLVGVNDPSYLGTVADQTEMLALTGTQGSSWCIRTDLGFAFYLTGTHASSVASWTKTPLYLMDGDPAIWQSSSGAPHHIECYLKWQQG
jgi:hypothetical protein